MNGRRVRHGPDLSRPFTVMRGFVAVIGEDGLRVRLPPGATWPGTDGQGGSGWMMERLQPAEAQCTPDLELTWHVTPRDLESGAALMHAQLLTQGHIDERLELLGQSVDLGAVARVTSGHLIGATRETVGLTLRAGRAAS